MTVTLSLLARDSSFTTVTCCSCYRGRNLHLATRHTLHIPVEPSVLQWGYCCREISGMAALCRPGLVLVRDSNMCPGGDLPLVSCELNDLMCLLEAERCNNGVACMCGVQRVQGHTSNSASHVDIVQLQHSFLSC